MAETPNAAGERPHPSNRYLWSARSRKVYHDRFYLTERCNTDGIADRRSGPEPPPGRLLCIYCRMQQTLETSA